MLPFQNPLQSPPMGPQKSCFVEGIRGERRGRSCGQGENQTLLLWLVWKCWFGCCCRQSRVSTRERVTKKKFNEITTRFAEKGVGRTKRQQRSFYVKKRLFSPKKRQACHPQHARQPDSIFMSFVKSKLCSPSHRNPL